MAASLLELRARIPRGACMFVLYVLYSKDKGTSQDNQDKETSTDEVQRATKRKNKKYH